MAVGDNLTIGWTVSKLLIALSEETQKSVKRTAISKIRAIRVHMDYADQLVTIRGCLPN